MVANEQFRQVEGTGAQKQVYLPNRSCENCRAQKSRCIPSDPQVSSKCDRCFKTGKECYHALPTRRKPRKRTDAKVAELEKEVRALSQIVRKQRQQQPQSQSTSEPQDEPSQSLSDLSFLLKSAGSPSDPTRSHENFTSVLKGSGIPPALSLPRYDVIGRGLVTFPDAQQAYDHFIAKQLPQYPIVAFAENLDINTLQSKRPVALLAIIAAGIEDFNVDASRQLCHELTTVIADEVIISGQKSMDLLQAVLIAIMWHLPPRNFEQFTHAQYCHLAASMASDIKFQALEQQDESPIAASPEKSGKSNTAPSTESPARSLFNYEHELLEYNRAQAATYLVCSNVGYILQRPSPIPFSGKIQAALQAIECSSCATPLDSCLINMVRLRHIMEESASTLGLDDPTSKIDLGQQRVQLVLKTFDRQLKAWRESIHEEAYSRYTHIDYSINRMHLHEIALYAEQTRDAFAPPFYVNKLDKTAEERRDLTPAHTDAMLICLSSAQSVLDVICQGDVDFLRSSPTMTFVHAMSAMLVLLKLDLSIAEPSSPFARVCGRDSPRAGEYLRTFQQTLRAVSADNHCIIANKFSKLTLALEKWYVERSGVPNLSAESDDFLQPLRHLMTFQSADGGMPAENMMTEETTPSSGLDFSDASPEPSTNASASQSMPAGDDSLNFGHTDWAFISDNYTPLQGHSIFDDLMLQDIDSNILDTMLWDNSSLYTKNEQAYQ